MTRAERLNAQINLINAYHRLFLGEDGHLKPDAKVFFGDLSDACQLTEAHEIRDNTGRIDAVAHVHRDGRRMVWEHVQRMMAADVSSLRANLQAALEE